MQLQRYFEVSQSPDVGSLEKRLVRFAEDLDFAYINAAVAVDRPGSASPPLFLMIGNTPTAYQEQSLDRSDALRDPVIKRLKTMSVPFVYDQDLYVAEGAADLWETQAHFGYRTGVAVALHLPGFKHFLLGVDRPSPLPGRTDDLTRIMADLQLLAVHAQSAAVRLLLPSDHNQPPPALTDRELEVLRWTMDGKSAWSVGTIMGITEHTVNFHLRSIFKKLGAASKHQAVLIAIKHGLI